MQLEYTDWLNRVPGRSNQPYPVLPPRLRSPEKVSALPQRGGLPRVGIFQGGFYLAAEQPIG